MNVNQHDALDILKYNKQPKFIILSVDIFSLQKRKDLFESNQFLPLHERYIVLIDQLFVCVD